MEHTQAEDQAAGRRFGDSWKGTLQKQWTPELRLLFVNPRTSYPR